MGKRAEQGIDKGRGEFVVQGREGKSREKSRREGKCGKENRRVRKRKERKDREGKGRVYNLR